MTVASRICVVSGASRRIGRAIAEGFGRCGAGTESSYMTGGSLAVTDGMEG